MANNLVLEATRREVMGKQVKKLRAQGIIPGVLYGPAFEPVPFQVEWAKLRPVLREAGGSQVVEFVLEGEKHHALVREVQRDAIRGDVLHVDFYRVRMDVAIRTEVPIVLVNDELILSKGGLVNQEMNAIEVECLPTSLPSEIVVDLSHLSEVGERVTVGQLPRLEGVTYMMEDDVVVVSTQYMAREEAAEGEEEGLPGGASEPELIRREREEDEES